MVKNKMVWLIAAIFAALAVACNLNRNSNGAEETNGLSARALAMRAAIIERFDNEVTARAFLMRNDDSRVNFADVPDRFWVGQDDTTALFVDTGRARFTGEMETLPPEYFDGYADGWHEFRAWLEFYFDRDILDEAGNRVDDANLTKVVMGDRYFGFERKDEDGNIISWTADDPINGDMGGDQGVLTALGNGWEYVNIDGDTSYMTDEDAMEWFQYALFMISLLE
ncbi:MAG: hypothetical protein FWE37_01210 [Spirochaetaceae bacterium]|nr:hypothetical protein [Spirochaetaceae bacterium]